MTGVDIYGEDSVMPNTEDGKWSVIGPKTVDQIYQSKSDVCGGGLREFVVVRK